MTNNSSDGILNPGDVLNNTYVIAELVASGGTGEVYRATNRVSGREIAIKILKEEFAQNEQFTDLMKREASVLHEVIDPSVVRYYDLLESDMHDGFLFIVMEFIHGQSLADVMRRKGPLPQDVLLKVAQRILLGLKAAHNKNAFHRDLSPDNVILRDGDPMQATLIDFGIAKDVNEGAKTVVGDGFAGKYQYAAPEQMEGRADARSDLYSLGMTLIGAFRGQSPSAGSSLMEIVRAKAEKPDISDMSGDFLALVSRLVEPEPADRFASAQEALEFLENGAPATPVVEPDPDQTVIVAREELPSTNTSPPTSVPPPPVAASPRDSERTIERLQQELKPAKKGKAGLWAGIALTLLVGGGTLGWVSGMFDPAPNPKPADPPVQIAISEDPVLGPTGVPQSPSVAVPNPDTNPDFTQPADSTVPTPQTDTPPSPIEVPAQDPTAPPPQTPDLLASPTTTPKNDTALSPDSLPGQRTPPSQVATPDQTPDTAPTAGTSALPFADPYVLTIQRISPDDPLLLTGNLPSGHALAPITTILEDQLDAFAVQAKITPAAGMPVEGWADRVVAIALSFAQLDAWTVAASGKTVTLRAQARSEAERTALLSAARRAVAGTGMKIEDRITVAIAQVKLAELSAELQTMRSCGPLRLSGGADGILAPGDQINVSGNLASADEISAIQDYLQKAAPGRRLINTLTVINRGVCSVMQILPDQKSNKLRVDFSLGTSDDKVVNDTFHLGDNPVIDIAVDARAKGFLNVIFVDQGDQVFHLLPHQARTENALQSIGTVRKGIRYIRAAFPINEASVEQLGFKVVEPLGINMIVAVVTPEPLFTELRPRAESNAAFVAAAKDKLIFKDESAGIVTFRSLITEP